MIITSTSTINAIDLINLSKDVAQLNLGYLGISVTILTVLGGVFIYFNIKPLKDALDKQESIISNLRKEANELLVQSGIQTQEALDDFKITQTSSVTSIISQQKENTDLEIINKIQSVESSLTEKIESISDNKDSKLKEIILSEMINKLAILEKNLTLAINTSKENYDKKVIELEQTVAGVKSNVRDTQRDIKELKVYKYSKENQMGAVIYSIELLKEDIDEKRWSILNSLQRLKGEIDGNILETEYIARIEEQLARIKDEPKYKVIIEEIRKVYLKNNSGQ